MSCTFALAIPYISVVCADTRINFGQANGGGMSDSGTFSITYNDRIKLSIKDHDRKIRRYPGGWETGSGSFAVVDWCLSKLSKSNARTPGSINSVLQNAVERIREEIKDELTEGRQLDPTTIIYVYNTTNSFKLAAFSIDARISIPDTQQYFMSTPNDISKETIDEANMELKSLTAPNDRKDIPRFITQIARAFQVVHKSSATVSDILDMAVSIRTRQSGIIHSRLLATNTFLITAGDDQILNLLQPSI